MTTLLVLNCECPITILYTRNFYDLACQLYSIMSLKKKSKALGHGEDEEGGTKSLQKEINYFLLAILTQTG